MTAATPHVSCGDKGVAKVFASGVDYWQRRRHGGHSWAMQEAVATLLLVRQRLGALAPATPAAALLPCLPEEIWLAACTFLRGADVGAAAHGQGQPGLAHANQAHRGHPGQLHPAMAQTVPHGHGHGHPHHPGHGHMLLPACSRKRDLFRPAALPHGWEEACNAEGRKHYIDHTTQSTSWSPPWQPDGRR